MKIGKYYLHKSLLICIVLFGIISCFSIYSATKLLSSYYENLLLKQIIWYVIGSITVFLIMKIGNEKIFQISWHLYWMGIISLIGLLLFAPKINDARCWYFIPGIGGIQPSEFMKIALIITIAKMINDFHQKYPYASLKQEFIFLCKISIVILIPSLLTFLQPDTGVVLIYLLITFTMLFTSGIRMKWFVIIGSSLILVVATLLIFYFCFQESFINIFGNSFFLRMDRLLNWSNSSGYQLENGMAAIGAAGLSGFGFGQTPIYFPEPQTDFIFAVYANNTGFIGSIILLSIIVYFDLTFIKIARNTKKLLYKYLIAGVLGMLIYQQVQNIGMTFGLLPITGITLPFISYGGSSLLSYFIIMGIIFNITKNKKQLKFSNKQ